MFSQNSYRLLMAVVIGSSALTFSACANSGSNNNNQQPATETTESVASPSPAQTGFEGDLEYVRKGQYTYVWVFSRKDGKPLNKEDVDYLRKNAPQVVDWVTTDEGKKVIAGTNFNLAEGNLGLIQKRFNAEDYTGR